METCEQEALRGGGSWVGSANDPCKYLSWVLGNPQNGDPEEAGEGAKRAVHRSDKI